MITITGINNRPHAPEPYVSMTQAIASGVALCMFVVAIAAWAGALS
jgi:hypothetical protein